MRRVLVPHGYPAFREVARRLLAADVPPSEVALTASARPQVVLTDDDDGLPPPCEGVGPITVPLSFVRRSARVLCHRAPEVVDLTYRLLWRVTHGERRILADPAHPDVQAFLRMEEAVVRDVHAFVAAARFAPFPGPPRPGLIAFHAPAHRTARLAAARFASQLRGRPFVVATLDEVALFDGAELSFGPPPEVAPGPKELAPWWQGYYATQADALGALAEPGELFALREAAPWPGASAAPGPAVPTGAGLGPLKAGAAGCLACPRGRRGGFVFGDGPVGAALMLVAGRPEAEDVEAGRPLSGPGGEALERALHAAGVDRSRVYLTLALKHTGGHPARADLVACRAWLEAEIRAVAPRSLVLLGPEASWALLGPAAQNPSRYGQVMGWRDGRMVVVSHGVEELVRRGKPTGLFDRVVQHLRAAGAAAQLRS
ncbi:MAG: DUF4130 domain-containing protein [Deltaproteobacteria bacterium]|nr:DUF4130 domain-containing protein [Deltaproteobacteria bacterium]